jgi:aspartate-semialdehyde dehydrogenase
MMKQYTFAVVGALGNVGTEMLSILETSDLPIANLVLLDIAQNAGTKVKWRGEEYTVAEFKCSWCSNQFTTHTKSSV